MELKWLDNKRLIAERVAISNALQQHSIEDVMRFDAAANEQLPLTQAGTTSHPTYPPAQLTALCVVAWQVTAAIVGASKS